MLKFLEKVPRGALFWPFYQGIPPFTMKNPAEMHLSFLPVTKMYPKNVRKIAPRARFFRVFWVSQGLIQWQRDKLSHYFLIIFFYFLKKNYFFIKKIFYKFFFIFILVRTYVSMHHCRESSRVCCPCMLIDGIKFSLYTYELDFM